MKSKKTISLRTINNTDTQFLFELLKQRDHHTNISHKKMPTFAEHQKFVKSNPYSKWYIILRLKERIGSIYLSKNDEIGIFISKDFQGTNIGKTVLAEIIKRNPRKHYLANVNPKNKKSIKFFKNNKFKLIQCTFELDLTS